MIMEKAIKFLQTIKDVAFATVVGDRPQIRVFQIMKSDGVNLWFATSPQKDVYRQLTENPNVEILAMRGDVSVRISGKAVFDVPESTAREIYAANEVLPRLYKKFDDLVYFRLKAEWLDYFDLTPNPPLFEHYDL